MRAIFSMLVTFSASGLFQVPSQQITRRLRGFITSSKHRQAPLSVAPRGQPQSPSDRPMISFWISVVPP